MFTHQQFIDNECTNSEYYSQFINTNIKKLIIGWIGTKRIIESIDPNFNDIPLLKWDLLYEVIYFTIDVEKIRRYGDYFSLGFSTCVAKEAAKQIKYQHSD